MIAAGFVATIALSAGCSSPAPGASVALGSAAARAELRGYIEDVDGATAFRYGATDDLGQSMDTVKIIQVEETGGFAGVYHTWRDDPGVFEAHLATSTDLLSWTWQVMLASEASQPTIRAAQDGGYVTAWEVSRLAGDPSPPAFAYYPTWEALLAAEPTMTFEAELSLSPCCEGTPNLYSASSAAADVGIHFYDDYVVDRQARGTMTWKNWSVTRQPQLDAALTSVGVEGHIGDRDAIRFRGFDFLLLEGQLRPEEDGAWRLFLVDELTGTAQPLDIRTPQGKVSVSNATLELVELDGRPVLVVGVFVHQGTDAESGQLIYYRSLDGE
ncbi:MAG TPA: hypothetical protein VLS28_06500 [Candidatus Sulfomarinibacteraceae bacterium]|nr:hypothetical protein [Candidatus Sulfomarinibacteraceae bacterium]